MQQKKYITDFTTGNITKQLAIFAWPLFLSNLLQVVYNMVDMIIVGQKLGKVGLSAVAIGGDISSFMTFLAMGFANAGQVIIAQYIGAGKKEQTGRFIANMFSVLMLCAAGISVICLILRNPILQVMNTPAESYAGTLEYATVSMIGLVFVYGYNICSAVLRGFGDSRHPFIFISISAILNVILDMIFVLGLNTGAMGAALATVISQGVSFVCCGIFLVTHARQFELQIGLRDFGRFDAGMLKELLALGTPMAIKSASIHVSKLFVNSWINSYGVAVSAFAGVANKVNSISNLLSNSMNTAGSSMVGQNIGARRYERVPMIIKRLAVITFSMAAAMSVLMYCFPTQIFGIFTEEWEVIEIGLGYVPIAILIFFGSASRAPMNALINGSGKSKINFATAILDGIVLRIGLSVLFGLVLGLEHYGFWLGDALAGFTPMWIGLVFFISGKWKKD